MPPQHQFSLPELPAEVLDAVFCRLPVREAARTLPLVCRGLADHCRASRQLWHAVALPLEDVEQPWKAKRARLQSFVE